MDGGTGGGGELEECKNMQDERRGKTVKTRGRGAESGVSGIKEWGESTASGDGAGGGMVRCGTMMSSLG